MTPSETRACARCGGVCVNGHVGRRGGAGSAALGRVHRLLRAVAAVATDHVALDGGQRSCRFHRRWRRSTAIGAAAERSL